MSSPKMEYSSSSEKWGKKETRGNGTGLIGRVHPIGLVIYALALRPAMNPYTATGSP